MKHIVTTITILVTFFFVTPAIAVNTHDPGINKRQKTQQKRIVQGIKSGELTARETAKIEREQARIASKEKRFKSDCVLTKRERAILHRDLNHASRHIYREKHDRQHRR